MEELALLLADILEDWLFTEGVLTISEAELLLTEMAFDMELEADVDAILATFDSFKAWSVANLPSVTNILNGIVGLQLIYNLIVAHSADASAQKRTISLEVAMGDVEATLVKNFSDLRNKAKALLEKPGLTEATKAALNKTVASTPTTYWSDARMPIMQALEKIPLYV